MYLYSILAVTTQNEALRKRFPGVPGDVVTFFGFVAEEVRHILAKLGKEQRMSREEHMFTLSQTIITLVYKRNISISSKSS